MYEKNNVTFWNPRLLKGRVHVKMLHQADLCLKKIFIAVKKKQE